ncbi:hypothetical protein CDSE_0587 [Candidatus Kinetoplastibacterium desouzaii TCC079E]|uniref:UPF0125 protein CDSE_0587 n=1 Tax=Candidatus Kinetoplastidibacterium desouzai TCC079E TaxID=1208919 RepID=M1M3R8_9PROT|nr:RnfH family protein [Candidatus Kinetoplastibacterium desouzaii]AGF46890.1 hypothetical protein CDSE_0587 [Candidatus Kinetoplastibacterium desouzaii TCC079E]
MNHIIVSICYVDEFGHSYNESLNMLENATILDALNKSTFILKIKNFEYLSNNIGIFGKLSSFNTKLHNHDRIEVYRELLQDPKQSRIKRITKKNKIYL